MLVWSDITTVLHSTDKLNRYCRLQNMMIKIAGDVVMVDDAVFVVKDDKQERRYDMTVCMIYVTVGCCIGLIGMGML